MTMKIRHFGFMAPEMYHFRPLITYSSPSRSIRVAMLVASDEATSGSVIAKAERITPSSSGSSQVFFCCSVPKSLSTSMLPVSGAAQLSAGGARWRLRPVISASGAYCRLVSWGPRLGRKRFHSPRRRASRLSSSTTGGALQTASPTASSRCRAKTGSDG